MTSPPGPGSRTGRPAFDAVILAGGQASRLGGADKPGLVVGGSTLAAIVVTAAVTAGARQVILVGPQRPELPPLTAGLPDGLTVVREDPPGSGPVPALRCGLACVRAARVAVLAADMPFLLGDHLRALLAAVQRPAADQAGYPAPGRCGGAVFADAESRPQWLAGCWRTGILRSALAAYSGASLRGLLAPLHPALVRCAVAGRGPAPWLDCDSPADLELARRLHAGLAARPAQGAPGRKETTR